MGLDPCPHCGRSFEHDNKGARKQHVMACERKKEQFSQPQKTEVVEDPTPMQTTEQQSGQIVASEGGSVVEEAGAALTKATADHADAETKAGAVRTLAGAAADLFAGQLKAKEEMKDAGRRNAQKAELDRVEEFPTCETEDCNEVFNDIPPGATEYVCDGCGAVYEVY